MQHASGVHEKDVKFKRLCSVVVVRNCVFPMQ